MQNTYKPIYCNIKMTIENLTIDDEELKNLTDGEIRSFEIEPNVNLPKQAYLLNSNGVIIAKGIRLRGIQDYNCLEDYTLVRYKILEVY